MEKPSENHGDNSKENRSQNCKQVSRCFITGTKCTHRHQIQACLNKNRGEGTSENAKNEVTVFVVMPFTEMTFKLYDMVKEELENIIREVYEIKDGYIRIKTKEVEDTSGQAKDQGCVKDPSDKSERIHRVRFMRADFQIITGNIVCQRVCRLIQEADIVVVDVSYRNPNVFFEFGMAMALGKQVIPICFSEKYYAKADKKAPDKLIYPFEWKRMLYEYFSIFYNEEEKDIKHYLSLDTLSKWNKEDRDKYNGYGLNRRDNNTWAGFLINSLLAAGIEETAPTSGTLLVYTEEGFNNSAKWRDIIENFQGVVRAVSNPQLFRGDRAVVLAQDNKLYGIDKDDPDGKPVGHNVGKITKSAVIAAKKKARAHAVHLNGSGVTGEDMQRVFLVYLASPAFMERIAQCAHLELVFLMRNIDKYAIDVNAQKQKQASEQQTNGDGEDLYLKLKAKGNVTLDIKKHVNSSVFVLPEGKKEEDNENEEIGFMLRQLASLKNNIDGNSDEKLLDLLVKGSNYPLKNPFKKKSDDQTEENKPAEWQTCVYTCLNMMVSYLRYVNEVYIDTHANDIIAYFWLGVCYASGVDTVRIERQYTAEDRNIAENQQKKQDTAVYYEERRSVFDVAGLWSATVDSQRIKSYFDQIEKVNLSILRQHHAYVDLPDIRVQGADLYIDGRRVVQKLGTDVSVEEDKDALTEYRNRRIGQCEEYYRHLFWNAMCNKDEMNIYLGEDQMQKTYNSLEGGNEVKNYKENVGTWDVRAASLLERQLAVYHHSDRYREVMVPASNKSGRINYHYSTNSICVGDNRVNARSEKYVGEDYVFVETEYENKCTSKKYKGYTQRYLNRYQLGIGWKQPNEGCFQCDKLENCPLNETLRKVENDKREYSQYGAMFLCVKNGTFHVYLIGGSGTVTYAIANALVEESVRNKDRRIDGDEEETLTPVHVKKGRKTRGEGVLVEIQKWMREKYLNKCADEAQKVELSSWFIDESKKHDEDYKEKFFNDIKVYMADVLSSYFMPFLTKDEIEGIKNGLWFYLQQKIKRDTRRSSNNSVTNAFWGEYGEGNESVEKACYNIIQAYTKHLGENADYEIIFEVEVTQEFNQKDNGNVSEKGFKDYIESIKNLDIAIKRADKEMDQEGNSGENRGPQIEKIAMQNDKKPE